MFVRNASYFKFLNSNLHLSMETELIIVKNNNQTAKVPNYPNTSQAGTSEPPNGVYVYMSSAHSGRPFHHYQKFKRSGKVNNYIHFKPDSEYRENRIYYDHPPEEPMDLTCTEKRDSEDSLSIIEDVAPLRSDIKIKYDNIESNPSNSQNAQSSFVDIHTLKRRGRKRKYITNNNCQMLQELPMLNLESNEIFKTLSNIDLYQPADNRQVEVLKAAKSLFSKRTRTLFHWMYPNTPKAQLKAAVATSWETLGEQEKEFYISQVLGRFGFPQSNLMVNPQLGGLSGILSLPPLDLTRNNLEGNEETSTAVSSLLLSENGNTSNGSWMHPNSANRPVYTQRMNKKRGRLGRPPGSRNRKPIKEEFPILKQITEDPIPDEFQDDPELNREFQQFRWALHFNDNKA